MEHKIYKHCELKDAEAVAKAFVDTSGKAQDWPFKFPAIKGYEVRVKITHTGLCHSDVHTALGEWYETKYPVVPGHEALGVITHLGADVKDFKIGDRVAFGPERFFCTKCTRCEAKEDNLCTGDVGDEAKFLYDPYFGGYATHIQAPAVTCFKVPENLPSDRAPPLLCAGVTLFAPLVRWGSKEAKVAVIGIGGLGHLGVKFAAAMGYHVTAFTSKPKEKEEEIKKMGAEAVASSVDFKELESLAGKFDLVLNTVYTKQHDLFNAWVKLARKGGTCCQLAVPSRHEPNPPIDIAYIVLNAINYCGSIVGSVKETTDMLNFAAKHNILPDCEIFEWEDFQKGFDKCRTGTAKYRAVVHMAGYADKNLKQ